MSKRTRLMRKRRDEIKKASDEINEIRFSLAEAYTHFNSITDPELMEACIFEINALRARYEYAFKRIKARLGSV